MKWTIGLVVWLAACGGEEETAGTGPTGDSSAPASEAGICVDAPITTWDNFGAGFVTQHCQACHASTAPDRNDAPETVVFDTEEDVWALADRVLARATGEEPTMPPQGGVSADDRYRLEVWLSCGG